MNQHLVLLRATVLAIVATASAGALGDTVTEIEPNDPIASAQLLQSATSEVVVPGFIGTLKGTANDVDFYKFYATQGNVVTIDIDNGVGGAQSIDLYLAVFDPSNGYKILRENDDAGFPLDAGSISPWDPRIDNFVVPATGYYVVGVTSTDRPFIDGGDVQNAASFGGNGDYTLVISGLSPAVQQISISVKPGHRRLRSLDHAEHGRLPVAILSSASFDATKVDESSLTFGQTGDEQSLRGCNTRAVDVNHDGLRDKICHFDVRAAGFRKGDLEGILKGKTVSGTRFEGHGPLKVPRGKFDHRDQDND